MAIWETPQEGIYNCRFAYIMLISFTQKQLYISLISFFEYIRQIFNSIMAKFHYLIFIFTMLKR